MIVKVVFLAAEQAPNTAKCVCLQLINHILQTQSNIWCLCPHDESSTDLASANSKIFILLCSPASLCVLFAAEQVVYCSVIRAFYW